MVVCSSDTCPCIRSDTEEDSNVGKFPCGRSGTVEEHSSGAFLYIRLGMVEHSVDTCLSVPPGMVVRS